MTDIGEFEKLYKQFRKDKPHDALVAVVHRHTGEDTILRIEPLRNEILRDRSLTPAAEWLASSRLNDPGASHRV